MTITSAEQRIAERVRPARRLAGDTQKEAADALKVDERTYGRWERGESAGFLERLPELAARFGTTAEELRGADGDPVDPVQDKLDRILAELGLIRDLLSDPQALRARVDELIAEETGK